MAKMLVLTETDLRRTVPLDAKPSTCVEEAFAALATKAVAMPPILRLDISEHRGEVDVKTAYVPGLDGFAIKISPGFFDNPKLGLPSLNGLMVLLSARTGLVEALLLDNGYLTQVRTAAAGAVASQTSGSARMLGPRRCSAPESRRGCSAEALTWFGRHRAGAYLGARFPQSRTGRRRSHGASGHSRGGRRHG